MSDPEIPGISFRHFEVESGKFVRVFLRGLPPGLNKTDSARRALNNLMRGDWAYKPFYIEPCKLGLPGEMEGHYPISNLSWCKRRPSNIDHEVSTGEFVHRLTS